MVLIDFHALIFAENFLNYLLFAFVTDAQFDYIELKSSLLANHFRKYAVGNEMVAGNIVLSNRSLLSSHINFSINSY